jgi:hypothetical protein
MGKFLFVVLLVMHSITGRIDKYCLGKQSLCEEHTKHENILRGERNLQETALQNLCIAFRFKHFRSLQYVTSISTKHFVPNH